MCAESASQSTTSQLLNRARRSVLYMPGSNQRALEKARQLAADTLILDLEDAVAVESKDIARTQVEAAVLAGGYGGRELVVRVNGIDTQWGREDLKAIAKMPINAVLIPKVDNSEIIDSVCECLTTAGAPADLPIWAMIETPLGVLHSEDIAGHEQVAVLVMGTNDLAKELRVPQTPGREGLLCALSKSVLAARAGGCDIIDGVYIHLQDESGLKEACEQGKTLGFDGKTLIHPRQLAICNQVFSPAPEEIEEARKMIAAWRQSQRQGVVVFDGRIVEELHVKEAQRLLAYAEGIEEQVL